MDLDCDPDAAAHCAAAFIRKTAMSTVSEQRYAATALAAVSLIWGYNFVMMNIGIAYAGPLAFATLQFLSRRAMPHSGSHQSEGAAIPGAPSVASGVVARSHACHQFPLHADSVATSLCGLLILIQPWNLCGGLAASLLATCAGMFWGVGVVCMTDPQKRCTRNRPRMDAVLLRAEAHARGQVGTWHPRVAVGGRAGCVLAVGGIPDADGRNRNELDRNRPGHAGLVAEGKRPGLMISRRCSYELRLLTFVRRIVLRADV